jgi:hypothetical protein
MKVFWSWQSDTPGRIGRHFVRDALNAAIEQLKEAPDIEEPIERETRSAIHLDQDRKGVSGSPDLARVILEKIEQSAVFVADVTAVGIVPGKEPGRPVKKLINPNVAIELGYALHALGDRSLLMVMNEHYGSRADLPFDLQSKAGPILFRLPPGANKQTIAGAARQLTARFVEALEPFIGQRVASVRQQKQFPEAEAKDGPARFRAPGEPLGIRDVAGFSDAGAGTNISLAPGSALWLRLMPRFDPGKKWASYELRNALNVGINLPTLIGPANGTYTIRAEDGVGTCIIYSSEEQQTNSSAFAFETGEVWAIDTYPLRTNPEELFVGEIERMLTERLPSYARFLTSLGLQPPFKWSAGLADVQNRRLEYPAPPGQMRIPGWAADRCISKHVEGTGTYDTKQSPTSALLLFFKEIYNKCGVARPDYLPEA